MKKIIKIAITGTESTGKTTITQQLAQHYQTQFVEEYARTYLETFGKNYQQEDIWKIIKKQLILEEEKEKIANQILFTDTDTTVFKIWLENAYNYLPNWFSMLYDTHHYDFYLLMAPDLAWEYDELREHQHVRHVLHQLYLKELAQKKANFALINGQGKNRLNNAVLAVDTFLSTI